MVPKIDRQNRKLFFGMLALLVTPVACQCNPSQSPAEGVDGATNDGGGGNNTDGRDDLQDGSTTDGSVSAEDDGKYLADYLRELPHAPQGGHLFGHQSTITMGVDGSLDWSMEAPSHFDIMDIYEARSDVLAMTGELPAIMGFDAANLILDTTDSSERTEDVETGVAALKLYRNNGGIIALEWHMYPIGLPTYRDRAYRMDESQNSDYIELMKQDKPFYRIANGFAQKDWWWTEFETKRLAPLAKRLKEISNNGTGIILRPFHEFDGGWFWWGVKWLEGDLPLNGKEALRTVFVETARYMKKRLPNILIALSSDKLDYVDDWGLSNEQELISRYREEFSSFLPKNQEDMALVDIYGMDLYTEKDGPESSLERFRTKLKALSQLAQEHGKIAAITEAGNRGMPAEDDGRQETIQWFNRYLYSWISSPDIHVSYALIWQNWSNNRNPDEADPGDGYFVPVFPASPAGADFRYYIERRDTLMLRDLAAANLP